MEDQEKQFPGNLTFEQIEDIIRDGDISRIVPIITPAVCQATNQDGQTLLMTAVLTIERRTDIVQLLLENGSNVNAVDTLYDDTVLHYAIDVGFQANMNTWSIIGTLIRAGADIEAVGDRGFTPLMKAVNIGTPAEVACLLAYGADYTKTFPGGDPILFGILGNGECEDICRALLRAGADPLQKNADGKDFFAEIESSLDDGEPGYEGVCRKWEVCRELARAVVDGKMFVRHDIGRPPKARDS